jgi:hypothetical protein
MIACNCGQVQAGEEIAALGLTLCLTCPQPWCHGKVRRVRVVSLVPS